MIHGTGYIIFKYSGTEYPLLETSITKDETVDKELALESDLSNEVSYYNYDERHEVECLYNIYKNASFITQFKTIYALRNNDVKLKLNDGNYFLDFDGNEADYRMTMQLVHYKTGDRKDYLLIKFRSLKPVDLVTSALSEDTLFTEKGGCLYPLLDEDGNIQIGED